MALFRRRRSADSTSAVTAFWDAWPTARDALANAVESDQPAPSEVSEEVSELVRKIHPDLDWEVGRAPSRPSGGLDDLDLSMDADPSKLLEQLAALDDPSKLTEGPVYAMTLRPGTSEEARVQAERWARSAPEDDQWAFLPVRRADHEKLSSTVTWEDHELDLSHVSVSMRVNQATARIEVGVYHPDNMFLSEETRQGVAEHVTLLALGEDDMVRWIGKVAPLDEAPLDPLPPTSMPAVVRQMVDILGGPGGWAGFEGRLPMQGGLEFRIRHPLTRRDYPALSLYVHVVVPYTHLDEDRLPVEESLTALTELEERLTVLLGDNGALFARQTTGGRRQYHYYLDPDSGVLPEFEAALMDWPEGEVKLRTHLDPQWSQFNAIRRPYLRKLDG
ncbi:DUF695 domain-containing protein [Nocardiopsis sp. NRRL B-16309]|uniref:DUF695 domain-containing protein n=1 Tax=Nocardiopsis sp. NRRL B-16309 TaxID=1519494 RepID=UPI0006AE5C10|nr:DUF695 domain-containing protein [Nocardiopsis sp. NRRL B-16309]KOX18272.1 hypothetical protein ADL05_07335 [Nocardiopsis sp. NRRL B-16309]